MPLLNLEPYLYPEDLLSVYPEEGDRHWWVLHTKPRAEKSLARRLRARGDSFFLPLYHRQWHSGGRLRSSYLPLFPGYLFLFGDFQTRLHALETNLVARALEVVDQQELFIDLVGVQRLILTGSPLSPEERLVPGTRVEIVSGPLAGMEGKILRRGNQLKFFVEVHFLHQGVSVEMESWMFRPTGTVQARRA